MRKLWVVASTVLLLNSPLWGQERHYDFSRIDAELEQRCRSGEFSGVVLVHVRGHEAYKHVCGYADIINKIPNTPATSFKIYSTSKLVTALVVMKLIEIKKMRLDASVAEYITDVPQEWRTVTIRNLLQHTSGIADHTELLIYNFRNNHPDAMRETLASLTGPQAELKTKPGTSFAYNNFGFELLAEAAARSTGSSFAELIESIVFQPAGMKSAKVEAPNMLLGHPLAVQEPGLAVGYNGSPDNLSQATNYAFVQLGAGAIHATAQDFVALDRALNAGTVVSRETLEIMRQSPVPDPKSSSSFSFGLGLMVSSFDGVYREGHTGGTNGYITDFERYPDDDAVMIALSNRGFTKTKWLRDEVAEILKVGRQRAS